MRAHRRGTLAAMSAGVAGALALLGAAPARAQSSGDGFLFRPPVAALTLRGGFDRANAGSAIFTFARDQLTLRRGDFSGPSGGAELAIRLAPRADLVLGAAYTGASAPSEFRHFVDNNDLPIEQTTSFRRLPLTAGVKAYLAPRGRSIGSFAWVPSRVVPYVGAGGGAMWYRFRQTGDFVNESTLDVFGDTFTTSGWAPAAYGAAGVDFSLSPHVALTGEGRYTWARATPGTDFQGFDRIDLSGFAATAGVSFRF